jgi:hypothetical protein
MDAHERSAVNGRVSQIKIELNYLKLTNPEVTALQRELNKLERKLADNGYRDAASLTTETAYVARNS